MSHDHAISSGKYRNMDVSLFDSNNNGIAQQTSHLQNYYNPTNQARDKTGMAIKAKFKMQQ